MIKFENMTKAQYLKEVKTLASTKNFTVDEKMDNFVIVYNEEDFLAIKSTSNKINTLAQLFPLLSTKEKELYYLNRGTTIHLPLSDRSFFRLHDEAHSLTHVGDSETIVLDYGAHERIDNDALGIIRYPDFIHADKENNRQLLNNVYIFMEARYGIWDRQENLSELWRGTVIRLMTKSSKKTFHGENKDLWEYRVEALFTTKNDWELTVNVSQSKNYHSQIRAALENLKKNYRS